MTNENTPLISIVIPTWNRSSLVQRLVNVINSQKNHKDLEIVIVDNASENMHWQILEQIAEKHRNVSLYRNSCNIGMTPNWNKAIEYARGEWIGFVCDDDIYKPDSIQRILDILAKKPAPCLILQHSGILNESDWLEPGVLAANSVALPPASGQFWHRKLTDMLGPFDERIKYCPDPEFWLRLASHFPVLRIKDFLVIPWQHDTNYMWEAFRSPDFLEQVSLSIRLCCKHTLGENHNETNVQKVIDDGIWETLRTVLNNTFLRIGKMQNFSKYFLEFVKLSIKMGKVNLMLITVFNLPIMRIKDVLRKCIS